jgi:hypothetical protein
MGVLITTPGPGVTPAPESSRTNFGSVTAPGAGATIASISTAAGGIYAIAVTIMLAGTLTVADPNNFKLVVNGATLATLPIGIAAPDGAGPFTYNFQAQSNGTNFIVEAVAAGGAAANYNALISVTEIF